MITKAPDFKVCPYCDGTAFIEVQQAGEGCVTRVGTVFKAAGVIHLVCRNCGGIIHSRVKRLDTLLTKAEKEGIE